MAHVKKAARYQRVAELAELVQVTDQLTKFPQELSGGQQQRVAIARALAKQPSLLLLDEPLSSLDATLREELRGVIRQIQRTTGVTTVLVTHDQEDALQVADQIMVLANGRLQQVGTGRGLYQHPTNLTVAQFIGRPRINVVPLNGRPAPRDRYRDPADSTGPRRPNPFTNGAGSARQHRHPHDNRRNDCRHAGPDRLYALRRRWPQSRGR